MSPSRPLLIFLWLLLIPALGFPVAKRYSNSEIGEDVLAGSDFLSVFMKTGPARSVAPSYKYGSVFGVKTRNSDYPFTNSVVQKHKDINLYSDINLKGEDVLESNSHDSFDDQTQEHVNIRSNYQPTTTTQEIIMTVTDRNVSDTTTVLPTTTTEDAASTYYELEDDRTGIVQGYREDRSTKPTVTQYWANPPSFVPEQPQPIPATTNSSEQPLQVISVRVSSSVRHTQKVEDPLKPFESEKIHKPPASTLVIQEQPTNIAIQRSSLNVEEATMPEGPYINDPVNQMKPTQPQHQPLPYQFSSLSKRISNENSFPKVFESERIQESNQNTRSFRTEPRQNEPEEEERKIQETDFLRIQESSNQTIPQTETPQNYYVTNPSEARNEYTEIKKNAGEENTNLPQALPLQYNPETQQPNVVPLNYQNNGYFKEEAEDKKKDYTEEKADTRDSRSEPHALAYQYNPPNPHLSPVSYHTSVSSATSGSRVHFYRSPPSYRRGAVAESVQRTILAEPKKEFPYPLPTPPKPIPHEELPEKSYEQPEENYEIDESISVVTNGRAHGIQIPTPTPPQESPEDESPAQEDNKSGYVVEGRNYKKYRVEEKTADGFIVGEYGVVSHDDGSLRGVRYTADSTINPRLIYDALVKFLSLK